MVVTSTLDGVPFQILNGGPQFRLTAAASIVASILPRLLGAPDHTAAGRAQSAPMRMGRSGIAVPEATLAAS